MIFMVVLHSIHAIPKTQGRKMTIRSYATNDGTKNYCSRFQESAAANHFRTQQNLLLSSIGIGTYLGNWDEATDTNYSDAIIRAVELGCNVIDTAANYRFQRSERLIGNALTHLIEDGDFKREEILICTKGGYLPFDGAPPANARQYVEETFIRTGIATFEDIVGGSHCMTPAYLQNQIDQSLRNMNIETIDVYYIHNPESQLGEVTEEGFEKRLHSAFERLEQNRTEGKINHYGIATWNGFRVPPHQRGYHGLERMIEIAKEVAGDEHGFRFIQLPFNLAMLEAFAFLNQPLHGDMVSTLDAAKDLGVTAIASASLLQGKVARGLPPAMLEGLGSLSTETQAAIQFVRSTPNITTALIGMSNKAHVEENLELAKVEPLSTENFLNLFEQG
jgi:aryl-alcohol dehydrogenase-like predicted oxidoreductase